jgi:short-subunit dehydrogenase
MSLTTIITGTSKGIGNHLCKHYIEKNHKVISISRNEIDFTHKNLLHFKQDITNKTCFQNIKNLINNEKI